MKRSVYIPQGLWDFVGQELISSKYVDGESLNLVNEEPSLRWLLLDSAEWQDEFSQVNLFDFDATEVMKEDHTNVSYLNLFVRETFRRKDILNKAPTTQEMTILKGYIGFDNVILMNNQKIDLEFEEFKSSDYKGVLISVDSVKLTLFIQALTEIYRFKIQGFKKEISDGFIQETMFSFLLSHSISPVVFSLNCLTKTNEEWGFEEKIRENIVKAINQQTPEFLIDRNNNKIAEFDVGRLFSIIDGRIHVNFGAFGLKTKGNLVGLGYILYDPRFFGAYNVQNVMDSWNWLIKKINVTQQDLQMALESSSLAMLLLTGVETGKDVFFLSLIVDLYELNSKGVDTTPKIEEFGQKIRQHVRKFEKLVNNRPWKAFMMADCLKDYLLNVSSECRLARLAESFGFKVQLGKNPDLTINGKGIEVKKLKSYSFTNAIVRGMKQSHDIIAIEVETLEKREITNRKAIWLGEDGLSNVLKTALTCGDMNEKILLFMKTVEGMKGRLILLKK